MTDDNLIHKASAHLQTARQLGTEVSSTRYPLGIGSRKVGATIDRVADELAAAIDLIATAITNETDRTNRIDQAVTPLAHVTAGDEQLIDDLAAAIETAQIELVRLERQHDLLRSRIESTNEQCE